MSNEITLNPFSDCAKFAGKHLHLGVTGSIACYKSLDLLRAWLKLGIHVSATLSNGAIQFLSPLLFRSLGAFPVYGNMFDDKENVFAHLEPGQIGGAFVAAPASADFIARVAGGFAGDMLACQALAFDGIKIIAPAMNSRMWNNKATCENLDKLLSRGWRLVAPGSGSLACGEEGMGRLAPLSEIFFEALSALAPQDMPGLNVLVTLGPTREAWDGIRFWSNPSSGKMGAALATAAWLRGARVTAVCGPGINICLPSGIRVVHVESAREMFAAAENVWKDMQIGIFCAAVADYRPVDAPGKEVKFKKGNAPDGLTIKMAANADILKTLAEKKSASQKVLGFAAEIVNDERELFKYGKLKLNEKNADIMAANRVNMKGGAFGAQSSSLAVMDGFGREEIWPVQSKADNAWDLCSWLLQI